MSYLNELKLTLLEAGGVDNWSNYNDSIQVYMDANNLEELSSEDKLAALEAGGVDNWEWYDEALEYYSAYVEYYENATPDERMPFNEYIDLQAKKEKELIEYAKVKEKQHEENEKSKIKKDIAELTEEKVIHKKLYKWLVNTYPEHSRNEINIIYSNLLQIDGPFQEQHGLFKNEFVKAKKYGLTKTTKAGEFFKYAGLKYIELVMQNKNFPEFVDKVKDTSSDRLIESIYNNK